MSSIEPIRYGRQISPIIPWRAVLCILFLSWIGIAKVLSWQLSNSMDGKGRWIDNVFIERLWRSLRYEEVYINAFYSTKEASEGIGE
jgi:hypothetical protein